MLRERVASDIYVFRSELYLQVTAGVIVTEEGAVVVDTLPFPRESKALRATSPYGGVRREFATSSIHTPMRTIRMAAICFQALN